MNRCMGLFSTLFLMLTFGCSDYTVSKVVEYAPEIEVSPESHDFGTLNAGVETRNVEIVILNIGNEKLSISSVSLGTGSSNFSLSALLDDSLEPAESTSLFVTYDPVTYEINSNSVIIHSNDDDEPEVIVDLGGAGDAPVIDIDPMYHDFGTVLIGCEGQIDIKISNIGSANLEISDIEYFVSVPVDFDLYVNYDDVYGELPWTISPYGFTTVTVFYTPLDILDDAAYIDVTSNDPLHTNVQSDQSGLGDYEGWVLDSFTQDGIMGSDILFVVDNSGSMSSNQAQLSNNFDTFINVLSVSGYDYQIAFITTDQSTFVGDIITPLTSDPVAEAMNQIAAIGYHGSAYERGMDQSWNATSSGADAGPGSTFLRDDAKLVVIYISDEDDFSTVSPSTMETRLLSLKSDPTLVVAHAVAGDVPGGCTSNGGASAGTDYHTLVSAVGGTFLSICAEDWGTPMEELARESLAVTTFYLSDNPVQDTIYAEINGIISTDWTYDSTVNGVTFSVVPADGSTIDITYATWADCETDTGDTGQ